MSSPTDPNVREFCSTRLKLRGDLIFTPQASAGLPYYMVEDPLNSRFFRLGMVEYTFASMLDGGATIHDCLSHLSTVLPNHSMSEADAAAHCRWLVEMDLAHTTESATATRLAGNAATMADKKQAANWNPLVFRLPLGSPDAHLSSLSHGLGWLFSPYTALLWLVLLLVGGYRVLSDWNRFAASSHGMFGSHNWLWLAGCWLVLKVVHEISHGLVCQRYGGSVRETGVMFILFAPLAYVDVTSSWRFRSRWQRMHVAAAGMYTELLIAAVAAIVWSETDSGWLSNMCFNTIVMAGVTTLMFNANPLMKFDGYYILSDWLALPNLYVNGQSYLRYWSRRWLLGLSAALPPWSSRQRLITAAYGWASFGWRILICVSMFITAVTMFHGAGIVLAGLALVLWLGLPCIKFAQFLVKNESGEQPNLMRFALTAGSATVFSLFVFVCVPWPGTAEAPLVVEYAPHVTVRAGSAGFVREIQVESGDQVATGQTLVVLENPELQREVADLELQLQQSELRGRQHEQKGELAAQQAEAKEREGLELQLAELRSELDQLTIRATSSGRIVGRSLATLQGTYLEKGEEILSIGENRSKELRVSFAQDQLDTFTHRVGKPVRVDVPGRPLWEARVEKVIPRASLSPPHAALAAVNGGPLAVQPREDRAAESNEDPYELLTPRFTAIVSLTSAQAAELRAGQRGAVSYRPLNESVGTHLFHAASRWIRDRLDTTSREG